MVPHRGLARFVVVVVVWLALACSSSRFDKDFVAAAAAFAAVHKHQEPPTVRTTSTTTGSTNELSHLCMAVDHRETSDDDDTAAVQQAKVRFSEASLFLDAESMKSNPVDAALSWFTSDVGSLVMGLVGLVLLLASRCFMVAATPGISGSGGELLYNDNELFSSTAAAATAMGEETRANLLAVFAIGTVLLNGLSRLDVQSVLAEAVELQGTLVTEPVLLLDTAAAVNATTTTTTTTTTTLLLADQYSTQKQLSWTLASIAAATPASTAILLVHSLLRQRWKPMAYTGVVHPTLPTLDDDNDDTNTTTSPATATPIMDRFLRDKLPIQDGRQLRSESYLPTLQALPGKTEFTNFLLPPNTQAALLLPVVLPPQPAAAAAAANNEPYRQAVLLLGSNQARSFTPRDIAWCQTVIARLETVLNESSDSTNR
jgi:hypothetical protein